MYAQALHKYVLIFFVIFSSLPVVCDQQRKGHPQVGLDRSSRRVPVLVPPGLEMVREPETVEPEPVPVPEHWHEHGQTPPGLLRRRQRLLN